MAAIDTSIGGDLSARLRWLHLAALWALGIAIPALDLLRDGQIASAAGWRGGDLVLYAVAVVVLPPTALLAAEQLVTLRASARTRQLVHTVIVGALVAVIAGMVLKRAVPDPRWPLFLPAAGLGVLLAYTYRRSPQLRAFVSFLSIAPVVALALFVFASPTSALIFPGSPSEPVDRPDRSIPVVFIVFDELPTASLLGADGEIDRRRYPAFARLADDATFFRNAVTVHDVTRHSLPAMLTGTEASDRLPPSAAAYPDNLFTAVAPSHTLSVHELVRLCPPSLCPESAPRPFPTRITELLPALARASAHEFAPDAFVRRLPAAHPLRHEPTRYPLDQLESALEGSGERPPLFFEHTFLPHQPWFILPSGQAYHRAEPHREHILSKGRLAPLDLGLPVPVLEPDQLVDDPVLVRAVQQRHLAQVGYADRLLGQALDTLRASGGYERALIIVTADHGISFAPGQPMRGLTEDNAHEVLGVPLIIKAPGEATGRIDRRAATTVDILPTIAELIGLELPFETDGRSLVGGDPLPDRIVAHSGFGGERLEISSKELGRRTVRTARATAREFGPGEGIGLFALGPRPWLRGKPASAATRHAEVPVLLDGPEDRYRDVRPEADGVPAVISGQIAAEAGPIDEVVIVIEGRIAATAHVHHSGEALRFTALVRPSAFKRGRNRVRVLGR